MSLDLTKKEWKLVRESVELRRFAIHDAKQACLANKQTWPEKHDEDIRLAWELDAKLLQASMPAHQDQVFNQEERDFINNAMSSRYVVRQAIRDLSLATDKEKSNKEVRDIEKVIAKLAQAWRQEGA